MARDKRQAASDKKHRKSNCDLFSEGQNKSQANQSDCNKERFSRFFPHPRTLRKATIQVNIMVFDGFSNQRIRNYLNRWTMWWFRTSDIWKYEELLQWFIYSCWQNNPAADIGAGLLERHELRRLQFCAFDRSYKSKSSLRI